tara:strand:+ start:1346 stop:3913 length:2568 start_codon:yes stop_codon:yes gene_type:complete
MAEKTKTYTLNVDDPLRRDLNSYWILNDFALDVLGETTLMRSEYGIPSLEVSMDSFYKKRQTIKVTKSALFDNVQLGAMTSSATSTTSFQNYVETRFLPYFNSHNSSLTSDKDTVFQTQSPKVTKDFSNTSDPMVGINEVKEEFIINFLEKRFEDAIAIDSVSELSLPNFYEVVKVNGDPPQDSFFDDYANNIPSPDSRYENIMISMDNYRDIERVNGYDKIFPLEVKLSPYNAAVSRMTGFHDALDDSNLDLTLMDLMSRNWHEVPFVGPIMDTAAQYNMTEHEFLISGAKKFSSGSVDLYSLDILAWARDIPEVINSLTEVSPISNQIYLGPDNKSIDLAKGDAGNLKEVLSSAMFLGKVKNLVRENLRCFGDINKGQHSYSEIVFYLVEKYTSPDAPVPIQNIWIPNFDQADPIEYIDTQVKYNKEYTYKVHAFNAVIGTKYYYDTNTFASSFPVDTIKTADAATLDGAISAGVTSFGDLEQFAADTPVTVSATSQNTHLPAGTGLVVKNDVSTATDSSLPDVKGAPSIPRNESMAVDPDSSGIGKFAVSTYLGADTGISNPQEYFQIDVITEPTVKLIKTELFNFSGFILDDPPMIPDVKFTPYIGVDNKITVNMHAQIGEYKNKPVILNSEDSDFIDSLRSARGLPTESLITYRTDDETAAFEIYRMETAPEMYEDFSNNLLTTVSTLQRDSFSAIYSWDMCFLDTIIPNKVYYYMVRSVDIHGHRSYPSSVYKVQMVNDSGAIYPLVEVIDMKPKETPRMKSKKFKKFLQLIPSYSQIALDYNGSNLISSEGIVVNSALGKENNITLGLTSPKLFGNSSNGQIFKIRLISKNTGKKIDLNVTFKVENEL